MLVSSVHRRETEVQKGQIAGLTSVGGRLGSGAHFTLSIVSADQGIVHCLTGTMEGVPGGGLTWELKGYFWCLLHH